MTARLTDPDDPAVIDALKRRCSLCRAAPGIHCVCTLTSTCHMPHMLAECPTAVRRIVHEARTQPVPKGGD